MASNQLLPDRKPRNPFREGSFIWRVFELASSKGVTPKELKSLCSRHGKTFGRILPTLKAGDGRFRGVTWITKESQDGKIKIVAPLTAPLKPPYFAKLGDRGRLVLPAGVREELGLKTGEDLVLWVEDDGYLRLSTKKKQLEKLRGMFADKFPNRILSEELIQERRREALEEDKRSGG
jgi:AbrB family looped-hinge helix DNA binding protein